MNPQDHLTTVPIPTWDQVRSRFVNVTMRHSYWRGAVTVDDLGLDRAPADYREAAAASLEPGRRRLYPKEIAARIHSLVTRQRGNCLRYGRRSPFAPASYAVLKDFYPAWEEAALALQREFYQVADSLGTSRVEWLATVTERYRREVRVRLALANGIDPEFAEAGADDQEVERHVALILDRIPPADAIREQFACEWLLEPVETPVALDSYPPDLGELDRQLTRLRMEAQELEAIRERPLDAETRLRLDLDLAVLTRRAAALEVRRQTECRIWQGIEDATAARRRQQVAVLAHAAAAWPWERTVGTAANVLRCVQRNRFAEGSRAAVEQYAGELVLLNLAGDGRLAHLADEALALVRGKRARDVRLPDLAGVFGPAWYLGRAVLWVLKVPVRIEPHGRDCYDLEAEEYPEGGLVEFALERFGTP